VARLDIPSTNDATVATETTLKPRVGKIHTPATPPPTMTP